MHKAKSDVADMHERKSSIHPPILAVRSRDVGDNQKVSLRHYIPSNSVRSKNGQEEKYWLNFLCFSFIFINRSRFEQKRTNGHL